MGNEKHQQQASQYKPEAWRDDWRADDDLLRFHPCVTPPTARERSRLFDLLGRINYKILRGSRVYVEVDGVVYKTLYGGYWRSVFTGIEHYLLRCEQVSGNVWSQEDSTSVDLPIAYSNNGWKARGHSLSFILNRDLTATRSRKRYRFFV